MAKSWHTTLKGEELPSPPPPVLCFNPKRFAKIDFLPKSISFYHNHF